MPFLESKEVAGKKRKRPPAVERKSQRLADDQSSTSSQDEVAGHETEILELETQINEGRKHYNNIAKLISIGRTRDGNSPINVLAVVALCRVFCRLILAGCMETTKNIPEAERVIVEWLRERRDEYADMLSDICRSNNEENQALAVTLAMRMVREEAKRDNSAWQAGTWPKLFAAILSSEAAVAEFGTEFFTKYDDVRFYSLQRISYVENSCTFPVEACELMTGLDQLCQLLRPTLSCSHQT